ncbi:inosine triphosphate pyrophosphatase-like protein [Phlyctochytrium arcticum]|nr:inosine triphosphate pyrophosphatase-like protein [Phlyctochytrium arcticum]
MTLPIILGSSSKFRAQILRDHGLDFTVLKPDIDEKNVAGREDALLTPSQICLAVAKAKADALIPKVEGKQVLVITCDQVVAFNGGVREKPEDEEQCREYLRSYASQPAETHSAIVITNIRTGKQVSGVDVARQYFQSIPEHIMTELIGKGDVMYCAGGFMIDDPLLEPYLDRREGDEDSIIGMPMKLLHRLMNEATDSES